MIKNGQKLYVITRRDMSAGYQGVQSIHAAQEFAAKFPGIYSEWREQSNYLGFLSVDDEVKLKRLAAKAAKRGLAVSCFCEPDVNFQITAIAIGPSDKARRLLKRCPLALKEYNKPKTKLPRFLKRA